MDDIDPDDLPISYRRKKRSNFVIYDSDDSDDYSAQTSKETLSIYALGKDSTGAYLRCLSFREICLSGRISRGFSQMSSQTLLNLTEIHDRSDLTVPLAEAIRKRCRCKRISRLSLGSWELHDYNYTEIEWLYLFSEMQDLLSEMQTLKSLTLQGMHTLLNGIDLTPDIIEPKQCPLMEFSGIIDWAEDVQLLNYWFPNLRKLDISYDSQVITWSGLRWKELETFNFYLSYHECEEEVDVITWNDIMAFSSFERFPKLRKLRLPVLCLCDDQTGYKKLKAQLAIARPGVVWQIELLDDDDYC